MSSPTKLVAPSLPAVAPVTSSNGVGKRWIILNLGCGSKTSPVCINIDWSLRYTLMRNPILQAWASPFLDPQQIERIRRLDRVTRGNLKKGIRWPDNSVDAVYHSHVLEHIDRESAMSFLLEIRRVLKPGGIHRVVVPDFQRLARSYLADFATDPRLVDWRVHDAHIKEMIEQCVRRKSAAVLNQGPIRQKIETWLFGDARRRGETHQWTYDEINLTGLLQEAGFTDVQQLDYRTSRIPNWTATNLDMADDGVTEHKPESIYVECSKR
jgi:ubiquinone/menaquinone biosynthesis C-methylase UbiE